MTPNAVLESTRDGGVILVADAVAGIVLASVPEVGICDADDGNDVGNNVVASVVVEVVDVLVVDVAEVLLVVDVAEVLLDVGVAEVLVAVKVAVVVDLVAVALVLLVCVVEETVYVVVASLQTQDVSMVTETSVHSPLQSERQVALVGGVFATDFTFAYRLQPLSPSRSFIAVMLGFLLENIQLASLPLSF